ncbi:hypothetical protein [Desulfosarcina alkanivorans]|jgi:hypothetical protein|uniref:hypothetical protein n=1 Tax=Desulfosarcina alkanivorans TaxID=571177 RepID=UPI0012D2FBDB|nr:hypothetical protein [Desulfosarcina alkanivorans]
MNKTEQPLDVYHPPVNDLFCSPPGRIVIKAVRDCIAMAGGIFCAAMTTLLLGL